VDFQREVQERPVDYGDYRKWSEDHSGPYQKVR
jgi:hypothetical protein